MGVEDNVNDVACAAGEVVVDEVAGVDIEHAEGDVEHIEDAVDVSVVGVDVEDVRTDHNPLA